MSEERNLKVKDVGGLLEGDMVITGKIMIITWHHPGTKTILAPQKWTEVYKKVE